MTDPPTLAPLITLDDEQLRLTERPDDLYGTHFPGCMSKHDRCAIYWLRQELAAQRRARVQEADSVRRQAFDEAIGAIRIAYVEEFNAWLVSPRDVVGRLERFRDQPAEDKATKQEMSDGR
jgi:hypothetical protein